MTSSSIVKYWGRINEFKPDLFDWFNNIEIPAFAQELFDSTKYESFFINIGTNKTIYRINSNSSCKAISIISTDSTKKWAGGRPGAHLGCTIFFSSQTTVDENRVVDVLNKLLSEASNKIEENGTILLNEEDKHALYDFAHEASKACIGDINYKKKKLDLSYSDSIFAVNSSQLTQFSKVFKYDFISSFYLIDFLDDVENRFYKRSENIKVLLNNLVDPIEILGCTNPSAVNYNPSATKDDGSCEFKTKPPFPWALIIYSILLIAPVVIMYLNRGSIMQMFESCAYENILDSTQTNKDSKETKNDEVDDLEAGDEPGITDEGGDPENVTVELEFKDDVEVADDTLSDKPGANVDLETGDVDPSNNSGVVSGDSNVITSVRNTDDLNITIRTTTELLIEVYINILDDVGSNDCPELMYKLIEQVLKIQGNENKHDTVVKDELIKSLNENSALRINNKTHHLI